VPSADCNFLYIIYEITTMAIAQKINRLETDLVERDFSKMRKVGKKTIKVSLHSKRTLLNMINKTSRHNQLIRVGKTWGNRAMEMKWRRDNPDWREKRIEKRKQNDRAVGPQAARWDKHWSVKDGDESSSAGEAVKCVKDIKVHPTILLKDMVEKKGEDVPFVRSTVRKRIGFIKQPANEKQLILDGKLADERSEYDDTSRSTSSNLKKRKISSGSRKKKRKKRRVIVSKAHRKKKRRIREVDELDTDVSSHDEDRYTKKKRKSPSVSPNIKRIKLSNQTHKRKKRKNQQRENILEDSLQRSSSKRGHSSSCSPSKERTSVSSDNSVLTKRPKDLDSSPKSKKRRINRQSLVQSNSSSSRSKSASKHRHSDSNSKDLRKRRSRRRSFSDEAAEMKRPCGISSDENAYNADEESERGEDKSRKKIGRRIKKKKRRSSTTRRDLRGRGVSKLVVSRTDDDSMSSSSSKNSRVDFPTSRIKRKSHNLPPKRREDKRSTSKSFTSLLAQSNGGQWTKIADEYLSSGSDDSREGTYDRRGNFVPRKKKSYRDKLESLRAKVLANVRSAATDHLSSVEDRGEQTKPSQARKHLGESDSDSDDESDGHRARRRRRNFKNKRGFKILPMLRNGRRGRGSRNWPRPDARREDDAITSTRNLDLSTTKLEARRNKFSTMAADNL